MTADEQALLNQINDYVQQSPLAVDKTGFDLRASAYIDILVSAAAELRTFPAHNDLRFTPALSDIGLITELALILDKFLVLVFTDRMGGTIPNNRESYRQFLTFSIANRGTELRETYPILGFALNQARQNFIANLRQVCDRLAADWLALQQMFGRQLPGLLRISSTGSDFHKHGGQTLILTFGTPHCAPFKLVYKPADLELDYLVSGNTDAVPGVALPAGPSLFELLNGAEPENAKHLPTYKIYPVVRGSQVVDMTAALEKAYGYLEFIEYDGSLSMQQRPTFYYLLGKLAAVAAVLSMRDVNQENLIVSRGKPYLIDMEASLLAKHTSVSGTGLIQNLEHGRSATPYKGFNEELHSFGLLSIINRTHNVLRRENDEPVKVGPYGADLVRGYARALTLLRDSDDTSEWLQRVSNVIARCVPILTMDFDEKFEHFFSPHLDDGRNIIASLDAASAEYTALYNKKYEEQLDLWVDAVLGDPEIEQEADPWALPTFTAAAPEYAVEDFKTLDIPSFYGKPSLQDLYDSRGRHVCPRGTKSALPRRTYFPEAPIQQLSRALSVAALDLRRQNAREEMASVLAPYVAHMLQAAPQFIEQPA